MINMELKVSKKVEVRQEEVAVISSLISSVEVVLAPRIEVKEKQKQCLKKLKSL